MSDAIYTRFRDIPEFTRARYEVDMGIDYIEDWLERVKCDLEPDFQRAHVWTEPQQIAFMEFLLQGGRSGRHLYFNDPTWQKGFGGNPVVVDGKQRLRAVLRFLHDEIPAFGTRYSEFTDDCAFQTGILRLHVHDFETRAEVLRWYLSLNTGGTDHTAEEIEKVRAMLREEAGRDGPR